MGDTSQPASLTPVIWAVAIASFGAFAFGYHLGVVNGPLNAIAADLGFAGNAALQGTVRDRLPFKLCMHCVLVLSSVCLLLASCLVKEHSIKRTSVTYRDLYEAMSLVRHQYSRPAEKGCVCRW